MPKLFTSTKNNLTPAADLHNYETASANDFEMQQASIAELQERCRKYEEMIATLDSPLREKMVRATNFRVDALRDMLVQNPAYTYVRVYNGIDTDGNHLLFMAPAGQDGVSIAEDDTVWLDDCCRCPPMGNCNDDPILAG